MYRERYISSGPRSNRLTGTYTVHEGWVYVRSEHGETKAEIRDSMPRALAIILLRELADAADKKATAHKSDE
jgi:hypothetical protein